MGRHSAAAPATPSGKDPDGNAADFDENASYPSHRHAAPVRSGPRRRVGFAVGLVILGVILLVFGLITLTTTDVPETTAGQDSTESAQPPAATGTSPSPQPTPSPSATPAPAPTSAGPPAAAVMPVTVLNNSPLTGLAARIAGELEAGGWPIAQLLNYSETQVPVTTVFFTPGKPKEKAAAQALAAQFPEITGGAKPRFEGLAGTGVTVAAVGDWVP